VSTATKKQNSEVIVELPKGDSFTDLVDELEKSLSEENIPPGSKISICISNKNFSKRQVKELDKLVLKYGYFLHSIINDNKNNNEGGSKTINNELSNMAYYRDTALLIRTFRSGQRFTTRGNVVILGDVNPGAEIVAGGNILVMGTMRGMAHAGAYGDERALIVAYRLHPTQLRIAHHITRPPDDESLEVESPELAQIKDGVVVIKKLKI